MRRVVAGKSRSQKLEVWSQNGRPRAARHVITELIATLPDGGQDNVTEEIAIHKAKEFCSDARRPL